MIAYLTRWPSRLKVTDPVPEFLAELRAKGLTEIDAESYRVLVADEKRRAREPKRGTTP